MTHADTRETERRTVRHTPGGGHSVDARELLGSDRAKALIERVAKELKVIRRRASDTANDRR
ncbi:MAG: hypothetical protein OXE73_07925 [Gammaproteobacteria bacterium]|nr:hypothetical protein [Gammaproteobacteria bacterium]